MTAALILSAVIVGYFVVAAGMLGLFVLVRWLWLEWGWRRHVRKIRRRVEGRKGMLRW